MVTLKDIARETGLSVGAVSQLLNSSDTRYAKATKQRVQRVARELGYVPNRAAQALSKRQSKTIGLLTFNGLHALSSQRVFHMAREVCRRGYRPLVYEAAWMGDDGRDACRTMIESRVAGVILVNPRLQFSNQSLEGLLQAGIPVVSNGGTQLSGIPKYFSDKRYGFGLLTMHLLRSGYRRITLATGQSSSEDERKHEWHANGAIEGFEQAVAQFGAGDVESSVELIPRLEQAVDPAEESVVSNDPYRRGMLAMQRILARPRWPEAVMCSNDSWALGALTVCGQQGVRVPEQIAITGFEGELIGQYGLLPLTTVAHPFDQIAAQAMTRLLELMKTKPVKPQDELHVIRGTLVVRDSCGTGLKDQQVSLGDAAGAFDAREAAC